MKRKDHSKKVLEWIFLFILTPHFLLCVVEWSRDSLWSAWNRDPVSCCEKCGVQPPLSDTDAPSSVVSEEETFRPLPVLTPLSPKGVGVIF